MSPASLMERSVISVLASALPGALPVSTAEVRSFVEAGRLHLTGPTMSSSGMPRLTRPTTPALVFAVGLLVVSQEVMYSVHPSLETRFSTRLGRARPLTATLPIRRSPLGLTRSRVAFAGIPRVHL